jgi:nicotinate-nucleotide adenylyltransferase
MRLLRLDQVWLLVSPGNPLKRADDMAGFSVRLAGARDLADGRRVIATDIEARLQLRYSVDTITRLRRLFPCARFVWLCGADILTELPRWRRWRAIMARIGFAVLPRPPYTRRALAGPVAHRLRRYRHTARAGSLVVGAAPAWVLPPHRESPLSSTALRARLVQE